MEAWYPWVSACTPRAVPSTCLGDAEEARRSDAGSLFGDGDPNPTPVFVGVRLSSACTVLVRKAVDRASFVGCIPALKGEAFASYFTVIGLHARACFIPGGDEGGYVW